jgi:predicted deacylase
LGEVLEELRSPIDGMILGIRTKPIIWPGEKAFLVSEVSAGESVA